MSWQQYFPTYRFDEKYNRDIALEEYKFCCKLLESEEKIFDNLVKYIISFGTIGISFFTGMYEKIISFINNGEYNNSFVVTILIIIIIFSIFMTKNFADKQRTITFSKRKIIILRRMLGIDYGKQIFLFQKGRLEGANMPFSIKLSFNYLFLPIPFLCCIFIFCVGYKAHIKIIFLLIGCIILFIFLLCLYRFFILDLNENKSLLFFRMLFTIFRLEFVDNFELILYMAKLSKFETYRMKINLSNLRNILIAIEDKNFYKHKGVDFKASFRALLCRFKFLGIKKINGLSNSGGSTITQQLFRTLFIKNINKKIRRRKLAEILLSLLWLDKILKKDEQLDIYLSSVRFDKEVYGIIDAMRHFFDKIIYCPSKAESFFLIERLSVISGKMLTKIIDTISRLKKEGILTHDDILEIIYIYEYMVYKNKIKDTDNILYKLKKRWCII